MLIKLEELRRVAEQKRDELIGEYEPQVAELGLSLTTQIMFLSDTIVVATSSANIRPEPEHKDYIPIAVTCRIVAEILAMAAVADPPLAYRGCVTVGEFELGNQFIVGPAVDAAADSMDLADGAFVWLLPKVRDIVEPYRKTVRILDFLGSWPVPIKGRAEYQTFAVLPFGGRDFEERKGIIRGIKGSFDDDRFDIQMKKENTLKFLRNHHRTQRHAETKLEAQRLREQEQAKSKPEGG